MSIETLKYPIGKFAFPKEYSSEHIQESLQKIKSFPQEIKSLTQNLSVEELNWIYRPGGWMIKQVVHHCVDSHMNFLIRVKWVLTEDTPKIKAYHEDRWAELPLSKSNDIADSLTMLHLIHKQLISLYSDLEINDLDKAYLHPENGKLFSLKKALALYSWHGQHHLGHIKQALKHKGQFNNAD